MAKPETKDQATNTEFSITCFIQDEIDSDTKKYYEAAFSADTAISCNAINKPKYVKTVNICEEFDNGKVDFIKNNTNDSVNDKFEVPISDLEVSDDIDSEISDSDCDSTPTNYNYSTNNVNSIKNRSKNEEVINAAEKQLTRGCICITPPNCNYSSNNGECSGCPIVSGLADIDNVLVTTYRL